MRQLFRTNSGRMLVERVPLPRPGSKELLVKVRYSLISTGTETGAMRKKREETLIDRLARKKELVYKVREKLENEGLEATVQAVLNKLSPMEQSLMLSPMGYSNAGVVAAKGELVSGFNVGDPVACAGSGVASHAEFVTVPVNLAARVPDGVDSRSASFATVGAIAMQGLRRANVSPGEWVVMTGLGLLGLLAVQIARGWGLRVIGMDIQPGRLELASRLGAEHVLDARDPKADDRVMELTAGAGADAVVLYAATGSSEPANQALRLCRPCGRVVVVGEVGMDLEREHMYSKQLDLVMSTSYGPGRYDPEYEEKGNDYPIGYVRWTENRNMLEFLHLLSDERVQVAALTGREFPIDQAPEAFSYLVEGEHKPVAVLFSYAQGGSGESEERRVCVEKVPLKRDRIRVAVIGAGGFASRNHLPNLLRLSDYYELVAVVGKSAATVKSAAGKFRPRYVTLDYHEVLSDPDIDMVVISTRHDLHARMVVDSIGAGKHVLVEKPLAMNRQELEEVRVLLRKSGCFLSVGFNRRYSLLVTRMKEILEKLDGPMFINYRVNAGPIAMTHWTQDPAVGGGRVIGECCHFFDLSNYLVGVPPVQVSAVHIPVDGVHVKAEDNVAVTFRYQDGSLSQLSYVSIGPPQIHKERVEVFKKRAGLVLDDFQSLEVYGVEEKGMSLRAVDKGYLQELEEFAHLVLGKDSRSASPEQFFLATEQTLEVMDIIRGLDHVE